MNWPDFINGVAFEFVGGLLLWVNVKRILRDKMVRGAVWEVTAFFSAWGWWNTYYYWQLGQYWSWVGGLNIVTANTVWLALAWKYRKS